MKYKYEFVWDGQMAFFYADDLKTAKEDFIDTYGIDPDGPSKTAKNMTIRRVNA